MSDIKWIIDDIWDEISIDLSKTKYELLLVAPYVTIDPIKRIFEIIDDSIGVTLITTIDASAIKHGALDIEALNAVWERSTGVVKFLKELHAKVICRDWQYYWVGSSNLTASGLQFGKFKNIEVMCGVSSPQEVLQDFLSRVIMRSISVDKKAVLRVFAEISSISIKNSEEEPLISRIISQFWKQYETAQKTTFSMQELPLVNNPEDLFEKQYSESTMSYLLHDKMILGYSEVCNVEDNIYSARLRMSQIPIVVEFDAWIRNPRWFGAITEWLHSRCEDRPIPYRSDIKELASRLIGWLCYLFPDKYSIKQPRHSICFGLRENDT